MRVITATPEPAALTHYLVAPLHITRPGGSIHHVHDPDGLEPLGNAPLPISGPDRIGRGLQQVVERADDPTVGQFFPGEQLPLGLPCQHGLNVPALGQAVLRAQALERLLELARADVPASLRLLDHDQRRLQRAGVRAPQRLAERLLALGLLRGEQPLRLPHAPVAAGPRQPGRELLLALAAQALVGRARGRPDLVRRGQEVQGRLQRGQRRLAGVLQANGQELLEQQPAEPPRRLLGRVAGQRRPGCHGGMPENALLEHRETNLARSWCQRALQQVHAFQDFQPRSHTVQTHSFGAPSTNHVKDSFNFL
mmetsp:Transcript_101147/g.294529  ORF Transcript_101147/g.294529 Transcript_101147/m.294529 type:complete len:310 (+) Transcript_101147:503-1432(+)